MCVRIVLNVQNMAGRSLRVATLARDVRVFQLLSVSLFFLQFRQDNRIFDEQKLLNGAQLSCVSATIPRQLDKTVDRVFPVGPYL